jgi:predicted phage tail component-like protein
LIKSSESFIYNGINSINMNIANVVISTGSGLPFNEPFISKRSLVETSIKGRDRPYLNWVKPEPLEFDLTFVFLNKWDDNSIKEVRRWLTQTYYKPMIFDEDPNKIYYAMMVSDPKILHNGLEEGYCNLKFRCDGAYVYSPSYTDTIDASGNVGSTPTSWAFVNNGDIDCKPIIQITKVGNGDFSIINTSLDDYEFKFTGLFDNEVVSVDNDTMKIITSENSVIYRYDDFNGNYMKFPVGYNYISIIGAAIIDITYQFKYL